MEHLDLPHRRDWRREAQVARLDCLISDLEATGINSWPGNHDSRPPLPPNLSLPRERSKRSYLNDQDQQLLSSGLQQNPVIGTDTSTANLNLSTDQGSDLVPTVSSLDDNRTQWQSSLESNLDIRVTPPAEDPSEHNSKKNHCPFDRPVDTLPTDGNPQGLERRVDPSNIYGRNGRRQDSKQRKRSQQAKVPGRRFACPFHKFNHVMYKACEDWSCLHIENVKRHVLGQKHLTSPHMSPEAMNSVLSIPPSKTGAEDRWHAIFQKLFKPNAEHLYTMPSPYHHGNTSSRMKWVSGSEATPPHFDSYNEPTFSLLELRSSRLIQSPSPDFEAYHNAMQRLTEEYKCHLKRLDGRRRSPEGRLQALDHEARQLETDMRYNMSNLKIGYERGLRLEAQLRQVPLIVTAVASQLDSNNLEDLPALLEDDMLRFPNDNSNPSIVGTSSTPTEPHLSMANDSGYGTMAISENRLCLHCDGVEFCIACYPKLPEWDGWGETEEHT